ncbi:MAG: DUF1549 domain-containing protein [Verrucomicrobiota bacterium]
MHRNPRLHITTLVTICASLLLTSWSFARTWTSTDGRTLEALFLGLEGESVELKLGNGQKVKVPLIRFIKNDQEAMQRLAILGDDTETLKAAGTIDRLLAKGLVSNGVKSFNKALPDDLFVRRVYLDIIGRIPTREEFLRFAENSRKDKRNALIDELLMHPGRASHLFNYFADMYRLNADGDFAVGHRAEPYIQWWKESLRENQGYHEMVSAMITATGNLGQDPAAGFLLRDAGMEFDAFSNFGQIMLGIDVSCAQCHDHPFEDWVMDDFYEMAAFFGQTQRTMGRYQVPGMMGMVRAEMPNAPEGWAYEFRKFVAKKEGISLDNPLQARWLNYYVNNALGWNVADNEEMDHPVPESVYDIGGEVFRPGTMVGKPAKMGGKTRREALADWLVDAENPRFALVIANRMWSRAFGRALVEPVHDFPVDWQKVTAHPELMAFLGQEMQRVNYDLREFMRILYNTRSYQTYSTQEEPSLSDNYLFAGPILRRMRAEQAWDSLVTLATGEKIDAYRGRDGSFYKALLDVDFENDSMDEIYERYVAFNSNRRSYGDGILEEGSEGYSPTKVDAPRLGNLELLRASELEQPARSGSMLDTFGQSDRFVTDQHTYDGTVPQVLALMNGPVTDRLTGPSSKVVEDLESLDSEQDKVRGVYFTLLSRFPSEDELGLGVDLISDYGDDGITDLAWALVNSPEFLFVQ